MAEWPRGASWGYMWITRSRWQQVPGRTSFYEPWFFFSSTSNLSFQVCPLYKKKKERKKLTKPCQKVAVLVRYDHLTEKLVGEVQRHTPDHLRARPWGEHMYNDIPQTFVHFRVLSRQSMKARKRKEKIEEVLQVSPGRCGCFRICILSRDMCVAEQKVDVWEYGPNTHIRNL